MRGFGQNARRNLVTMIRRKKTIEEISHDSISSSPDNISCILQLFESFANPPPFDCFNRGSLLLSFKSPSFDDTSIPISPKLFDVLCGKPFRSSRDLILAISSFIVRRWTLGKLLEVRLNFIGAGSGVFEDPNDVRNALRPRCFEESADDRLTSFSSLTDALSIFVVSSNHNR